VVSALAGDQAANILGGFRAGKRPIMLLQTPPQHGKSLTVIDFISWAVGHDPELRVI
jgi:hypothetical protein